MACFEHGATIDMEPRETVTLPDVRGATLRVAQGTVWITQERDPQDVVLRAGDAWVVERDGLTVLEAQDAVRLRIIGRRVESLVLARPDREARPRRGSSLVAMLAAFFASPARNAAPYA
jgi:hypothetical protein